MVDSKIMSEYEKQQFRENTIKANGGKRLQVFGNSMAILVPKMWAKANALEVDGKYYIKVRWLDSATIQISPLDKEEIEELFEVNNVR